MIGWVPHVMSAFLDEVAGVEVRRSILVEAGFTPDQHFRLDAPYADAACRRILDAACVRLGVDEAAAFALFAPFFLARGREMFPAFFDSRPRVRDFLLHQPEVHNTLSAGLVDEQRGCVARKFKVEPTPDGVRVFYRSLNRLAGLYAAIARQLGEELGERTTVTFEAGGPDAVECVMHVRVEAVAGRQAA
ncbi:heme NO-binding domain-containing protein [Paracraurococcus ruber]|uniref:Heme NO-binding domain-containing protein n=1 Tax=Paracraurococcus ruber TaxID=77675 RepID=A0ABS1D221_9PROT|nr:heme NO-binding domain-containing protein [Paracraurococcus ruber]MBK1660804.1 hypothetical protein [Paracraurococcus ruber]TDG30299.1 hypothetical protein E2C05_14995 [Paracraurococcus ruber]